MPGNRPRTAPVTQRSERAAALLREREARGLAWSIWARAVTVIVGLWVVANTAHNLAGMVGAYATILVSVIVLAVGARQVRARRNLLAVGRANAAVDCGIIIAMPLIWYWSVGGAATVPAAFNAKNEVALLVMVFTAINTLALRPLYPALVSSVGVLTIGGNLVAAALDPRSEWTHDNVRHVLGPGIKAAFVVWHMIAVAMIGGFLTVLARWARRMVQDVVDLDDENYRMLDAHARAVFEARTAGWTAVVSGMTHELNSPLGVMLSAANTSDRAAAKLKQAALDGDGPATARLQGILADNRTLMQQAGARMQQLLTSLQHFVRLDEADLEPVCMKAAVDNVVNVVSMARGADVRVVRELSDVPTIPARLRDLNQVLMTLLENAYDAMPDGGELTVRVQRQGPAVEIEVRDTGKGIAEAQLSTMFDIGLSQRRGRIGMGLGLPNARRVIEAHGGRIEVHSEEGCGACFTLTLPIATGDIAAAG